MVVGQCSPVLGDSGGLYLAFLGVQASRIRLGPSLSCVVAIGDQLEPDDPDSRRRVCKADPNVIV